jgi:hypothetical protein
MATREKPRVLRAKRAITSPWKGSMKHTRKMQSPRAVTAGLVLDGDTMGMR